ncbi:MAG: YfiR family protein [Planctomycetes bacterium]|nr:YfiR family protein [Planctomycetota bacterium]
MSGALASTGWSRGAAPRGSRRGRWGRRGQRVLAASLLGPLAAALLAAAGPEGPGEHEVKAQFLHRFALFIEWPADAFADPKEPLVFGVLGKDPFGGALEEALRDKRIAGRGLVVKRFPELKDLEPCHVLFVSESMKSSLKEVLQAVKGKPTVTVSDLDAFAEEGGVFRFFLAEKKVRFKINLSAAERARVTISSRLLQVGEAFREPASRTAK